MRAQEGALIETIEYLSDHLGLDFRGPKTEQGLVPLYLSEACLRVREEESTAWKRTTALDWVISRPLLLSEMLGVLRSATPMPGPSVWPRTS